MHFVIQHILLLKDILVLKNEQTRTFLFLQLCSSMKLYRLLLLTITEIACSAMIEINSSVPSDVFLCVEEKQRYS